MGNCITKFPYKDRETGVGFCQFFGTLPRNARVLGSQTHTIDGKELIFRVSANGDNLPVYVTVTDGYRPKFRARMKLKKTDKNPVETAVKVVLNNLTTFQQ